MKLIYTAGPFRGANSWEMEVNIRRAEALSLEVWRLGAACICPHANTRFYQGAADDSVWLDGDIEMLRRCDGIIMTDDWQRSEGAKAEHQFARERGLKVFYNLEALAPWLFDCTPRFYGPPPTSTELLRKDAKAPIGGREPWYDKWYDNGKSACGCPLCTGKVI